MLKTSKFFSLIAMAICVSGSYAQAATIIDHTSVELYDDIPAQYVAAIKAMRLNILGESHSTGYINGLNFLEELEPSFEVTAQIEGVAIPVANSLRADRAYRAYNKWSEGTGEKDWYTNSEERDDLKSNFSWSNDNNYEIYAVGFGWCWDMTWHNDVGGGVDPVYNVRWAGSSEGAPDGDLRWGLDSSDTSLTGNSVSMDTYLNATDDFQDHIDAAGHDTVVFFTTGPVDGGGNTAERGYQRYLKHEHIRNYVNENHAVLFDYADILTHNDSRELHTASWDGHSFPYIHPDNMKDYRGAGCSIDFPCNHLEDGDHIGEIGALRLGKAQWVLLAMLAGWNGEVDNNSLENVIMVLQVATGQTPQPITLQADVDGDGKIGVSDAISILQNLVDN